MKNPANENLPTQLAPVGLIVRPAASAAQPLRQAAAAKPAQGLNARAILEAVRYCWKWALPTSIVLAAVAGAVVYLTFVPQYKASAWLRIEESTPYLAFESNKEESSKGFVQTQIELLRSPMVIGPVVADPQSGLSSNVTKPDKPVASLVKKFSVDETSKRDNPIEWLTKKIIVKAVGQSELYTVSYSAANPQEAAHVVNGILDSYFRLRANERGQRMQRVVGILDVERTSRTKEVDKLRKAIREMAKQVTGRDPFISTNEPAVKENRVLADLGQRLMATEVDECVLRARLQVLESVKTADRFSVSELAIEKAVAANPQVMKELDALAARKTQLNLYHDTATEGKPSPRKAAAELLQNREKRLEDLKATLREQFKQSFEEEHHGKHGDELAKLRSDLGNLQVTRELIKDRYEAELKTTKQYNGDTVSLKFKQEELARAEKVLDLISERVVRLQTEEGAPARVWEMQRAEIPTAPTQPLPYLPLGIAIFGGLCGVPFALGILREQLASRISSAEFAERNAHLSVLGEITRLPTKNRRSADLRLRDRIDVRIFEESMDAMRTNLLLGSHGCSLRFLCVTSAGSQEGKTSVAVQLAVSAARASGHRVLIIDGDLRAPSINETFQLPLEPGLCEVLADACPLSAAIKSTWAEGVDALTAGVLVGNPHSLVTSERWESFLMQIPLDYRYVIIDTPPVLAASEALVQARAADAVLMCAMQDVTRLSRLNKATERVASTGAKVAGLVLNGVPIRRYTQVYGSYYSK